MPRMFGFLRAHGKGYRVRNIQVDFSYPFTGFSAARRGPHETAVCEIAFAGSRA